MLAIKKDVPIGGEESRQHYGGLELLQRAGFSGAISLPLLPDLIQIYTVALADGALTIRSGTERGTIWFERGEMVHAECGEVTGEEAVYQLLRWHNGQFSLDAGARATQRTITSGWQSVLMEGCRRLDEDGAAEPRVRVATALRELEETLSGFRAAAIFDAGGALVAQRSVVEDLDLAALGPLLLDMVQAQLQASRVSSGTPSPLVDCFWVLADQEHFIVPLAAGGLLYLLLARDTVNLAVLRRAVAASTGRLD